LANNTLLKKAKDKQNRRLNHLDVFAIIDSLSKLYSNQIEISKGAMKISSDELFEGKEIKGSVFKQG
jgi:hypothetical protein